MENKYLTLDDVLKEKLKKKQFRKYYEEAGKKLALGFKIARLREKKGLSQKALAEKVHTSQSTIARLENGDYTGYSLRTLEKIALATHTKLEIDFRPAHN